MSQNSPTLLPPELFQTISHEALLKSQRIPASVHQSSNWKKVVNCWMAMMKGELVGWDRSSYMSGRNYTSKMFSYIGKLANQLVLPAQYQSLVLKHLDDHMGLTNDGFYWPYMKKDVEAYVTRKCPCIKKKKSISQIRVPMGSITTSSPLELVSIDYLHLEVWVYLGRCGPFQQVCTSLCHQKIIPKDSCRETLQFYTPIRLTMETTSRPRESVGKWTFQNPAPAEWNRSFKDNPLPSSGKPYRGI